MKLEWLRETCTRLIVGGTLAIAGAGKLLAGGYVSQTIQADLDALSGRSMTRGTIIVFAAAEFVAGMHLILGVGRRICIWFASVLLSLILGVRLSYWGERSAEHAARGHGCGCFGELDIPAVFGDPSGSRVTAFLGLTLVLALREACKTEFGIRSGAVPASPGTGGRE